MRFRAPLLAIAIVLPTTGASSAVLLGASVSEQYYYPDLATPYPFVTYSPQSFIVGPGQELTISLEGVTTFNVDFSDTALDLIFDTSLSSPTFGTSSFNGLVFTSANFGLIESVIVGGTTNLAGFDSSRVSIVGNELRLNWNGLSYDTDTVVALNFTPRAVPEPATWAMMLLGFGAAGFAMRRRLKPTLAKVA